jgi:tRNA threonylcarbamoyladenosine biosynthesis protein TsaE
LQPSSDGRREQRVFSCSRIEKNDEKSYNTAVILYSDSVKETAKLASDIAAKTKSGVIALEGELGAGKTTFVQAFAKALGIKAKVKSPTFNILKKYKIPSGGHLYHIDCYRLKDHREAIPIGLKDIFKEDDALVLIEWPERIKKILPKKMTRIHIDHIGKDKRKITLK